MPLAYSYLRFSKMEQRKGDTIRRQTDLRDKYLHKMGMDLDTSFLLSDKGLSAFRGRNKRTGALKLFLDAVKNGRIKRGSYLVVESLDRLSREQVQEAFQTFMDLIRAGIVLCTLIPETQYTAETLDLPMMILALAEFTRAHGESHTKSVRGKEHWQEQRSMGKEGRIVHHLPRWIEYEGGKLRLIPERAELVRRIFAWCNKGMGAQVIVRKLNGDGVPPMGRGTRWHKSYIQIILRSRSTIGEHQPHVIGTDGRRNPTGPPIKDYYPAVVTPEVFAMAQQGQTVRNHKKGGINRSCTNLFSRMVKDANGENYTLQNRDRNPYLVNNLRYDTHADRLPNIPYPPFERCVLEWVRELKMEASADDPLPGLQAREADLAERLDTFRAKMKTSKRLSTLLDVFAELEADLEKVREEIRDAMTPRHHVLSDCKLAIDYLTNAEDKEETRRELRHHLALVLKGVVVNRIEGKFRSPHKVYYLTIKFQSGQERKVFFETPVYASGPWSEDWDFSKDTLEIRSELIGRTKKDD